MSTVVNCADMGMPFGGNIEIGRSGATRYPVKTSPRECYEETLRYQGHDYAVTNHLRE